MTQTQEQNVSGRAVYHSRFTKLLHLLVAAAVVHQLVISLVMTRPAHGRPGDSLFELHEWVGLVSLGVLLIFFLWVIVRRRETTAGMLYPWFSSHRRRALWVDLNAHLANLKGGRILLTQEGPLASAVHGLGLLLVLLMAATGAAGYFIAAARSLLSIHETLGPLVWAYLVGHAGLALLHQRAGHRILQSMFDLRAAQEPQDAFARK